MTLNEITVISTPLVPVTDLEVDAVEATINCQLPAGYREFITTFGEGVLGGCYIRIYPPWRIIGPVDHFADWRKRISQFWFWDYGADVLTKTKAMECVVVGDTLDGDELIFHPDNPDHLYVLPRESESIYVAGDGLMDALEWLCTAGILTDPFPEREFEPHDTRLTP